MVAEIRDKVITFAVETIKKFLYDYWRGQATAKDVFDSSRAVLETAMDILDKIRPYDGFPE